MNLQEELKRLESWAWASEHADIIAALSASIALNKELVGALLKAEEKLEDMGESLLAISNAVLHARSLGITSEGE